MVVFWMLTIICVACALAFVIPPIWLSTTATGLSLQRQQLLTIAIVIVVPTLAYSLYWQLGASHKLPEYYSVNSKAQRANNQQMRPYHARLQRELVKSQLNLTIDPQNVDLIINFASIHSKLSSGILQADIKKLLETVLIAAPEQITVLNLLAVNAYKTEAYAQAVDYWQRILNQFTPQMRGSEAEKILKNKITQTNSKIKPI